MELVFCMQCGQKITASAHSCPHCGAQQTQVTPSAVGTSNDATVSSLPDGVKGWSWGAFWLSWIWAIFNKTWIGLLALIPLVNLVMMVLLGFKGREWAWRNSTWNSIEHFNRVQKKWSLAGWIMIVVALLFGIAIGVVEDQIKHRDSGDFETNMSLDLNTPENSRANSSAARTETALPQAKPLYPMPRMIFGKIDFLGGMKRAGMDSTWTAHYTKYLNDPEEFWGECIASYASTAIISGGLKENEANAYAVNACQGVAEGNFNCLNDKSLDDAIMCLQAHIDDIAENGD